MKPIAMIWSLVLLYCAPYGTYAQTLCDTAIAGIEVNMSLSSNCRLDIQPYMVTSNFNPDYQYQLMVMTEEDDTLEMPVTGMQIGERLKVMITSDSCSSLGAAWSYINIEDKVKPVLNCPDTLIECVDFVFYDPKLVIHDCQDVEVDILSEKTEQLCEDTLSSKVTRLYRVTDASGNTDTCTQEFVVKRFDLKRDVEFPPAEVFIDCAIIDQFLDNNGNIIPPPIDLPIGSGAIIALYPFGVPTSSGSPLHGLNFKECGVRAYFEPMPTLYDGCKTTYWREWTVYEWHCTGEFTCSMIQKIVVIDTTAPEFSFASDTLYFYTDGHGCTADIPFSALDMSDPVDGNGCTDSDDLKIDILVCDYGNLLSVNDTIKDIGLDTLLVKVSVSDKCHQNTSKDSVVVIVLDRTPPQPICERSVVVALPDSNGARLPAHVFNAGSYDFCSDITLDVRRMGDAFFTDSVSFHCQDAGGEVMVQLRLTDEFGNVHTCMISAVVTDSMNFCPQPRLNITGVVQYEDEIPVAHSKVVMTGGEYRETTTDENGQFYFADLPTDREVMIMPVKDDNHNYGITTYDIILMQKHILGLQELDNPYKVIAADINSNGRINASDLFELRRLILADTDRFPSNTSYVFIPSEMKFINPSEPWENGNLFGYAVNPEKGSQQIELMAIKVGDVNKSAHNSTGRRDEGSMVWTYDHRVINGIVWMDIYAKNDQVIEGFQATLVFDPMMEYDGFEDGQIALEQTNYSLKKLNSGVLPISWSTAQTRDINTKEALFSIRFKGSDDGTPPSLTASDAVARSQIYIPGNEPKKLIFERLNSSLGDDLVVLSNRPNPWSESTKIEFELPVDSDVELQIYDSSLRKIWAARGTYTKGRNSINLNREQISGTGIFFYELTWQGGTTISKMMILR